MIVGDSGKSSAQWPNKGNTVMIRRTLIAATLAAGCLAPFLAASPANAYTPCPPKDFCLIWFYSTAAHTTQIGGINVPCTDQVTSWGKTSQYYTEIMDSCN
jgi:hypothetical protein